MIYMCHHDDGKEKSQSHKVIFQDLNSDNSKAYADIIDEYNIYVSGYGLEDVRGYGSTKEEAINNAKKALEHLISALDNLRAGLNNGAFEKHIKEIDCFNNVIK